MAKKTPKKESVETPNVATKAPKTPKTPKKETKPVEEKVVAETKVENTVVQKDTQAVDSSKLADQFTEFMAKFQTFMTTASLLKTEFRALEKMAMREIKTAQKQQAKKKRKGVQRSPSGFVKPTLISSELASFLGKPSGTEMARTEVTREINHYIREHNLQDKNNGRKINPDKNLATLLKITNGEELTYFNLQRYMSPHFAKASQTATAA